MTSKVEVYMAKIDQGQSAEIVSNVTNMDDIKSLAIKQMKTLSTVSIDIEKSINK